MSSWWFRDFIFFRKDNFEIQDDSLTFIIEEHHKYEVANREEKESLRGYIISLLKEYSEPPFKDYELEIIKKTYFIPSEISSLVYDSWCEFPLIKVSNKNISISYEEIRGRINSAVIIDQITNDTTFVQWIYDNNLNSATLWFNLIYKYLSNKKLLRILPCQIFHLS